MKVYGHHQMDIIYNSYKNFDYTTHCNHVSIWARLYFGGKSAFFDVFSLDVDGDLVVNFFTSKFTGIITHTITMISPVYRSIQGNSKFDHFSSAPPTLT